MMKFWFLILAVVTSSHASNLKFEEPVHEAHIGLEATEIVHEFKFTNSGSKSLKIRDADAGCSCLAVEFLNSKSTYAPGEPGVLRATFQVGSFQGTVEKVIQIWLDGDPDEKPSSQVTLRLHIPTAISLEPKTLKWTVNDPPETQTMRVVMNHEKPIHITSVTTSNLDFTTEIVPVKKGESYDIRVTPSSTASAGLAVIRIETDLDIEKHRVQQGFAAIQNTSTAKP